MLLSYIPEVTGRIPLRMAVREGPHTGAGQWALPVRPGGARQREMALRFAVNLLMYATCLNYKRDQVHVPAILKRRKWRVDN